MGDDFHALAAAVVLSSSSDEEDEIDFLVQHWKRDIPRIKNYSEYVVDNLEDDLVSILSLQLYNIIFLIKSTRLQEK